MCERCSTSFMLRATLNDATDHPALVAAARHGLGERTVPVTLDAAAGEYVLARAQFDRLTGFLATAVDAGVVVNGDEALRAKLREQWRDELRRCVRLEALAVRTAEVLDSMKIRWRLTKGPALAHLDYPDPAVRTFGDVDVVVHPSDWSAAIGLLSARGYRRQSPTLPGDYDARYGKGATLTTADGLELDLHRRFAIGRFGVRAAMEALFGPSAAIELAGRTVPAFDGAGRLVHACFHAVLGGFRGLRAFRDVAQLVLVSGADWQSAFALARQWKAEAVMAAAVTGAWAGLRLDCGHPAHRAAASTVISRRDQRVLQTFAREAPFRAQALTALSRLPVYEIPRYLWSLASPTRRRES